MVDNKVEMNSDGDSYNSLNNDPKNVQELTQYVRNTNLDIKRDYRFICVIGSESLANNSG